MDFLHGTNKNDSVLNAEILEFVAKTAYLSTLIKIKTRLQNIFLINITKSMEKSLLRSEIENIYFNVSKK